MSDLLAFGGGYGDIALYRSNTILRKGNPGNILQKVYSLKFSDYGRKLFAAVGHNVIELDVITFQVVRKWEHPGPVKSFYLNSEVGLYSTCANRVNLWDIRSNNLCQELVCRDNFLSCIDSQPSKHLLAGAQGPYVAHWDMRSGEVQSVWNGERHGVQEIVSLAMTGSSWTCALSTTGHMFQLNNQTFSLHTHEPPFLDTADYKAVQCTSLSGDPLYGAPIHGRVLVASKKVISLWDSKSMCYDWIHPISIDGAPSENYILPSIHDGLVSFAVRPDGSAIYLSWGDGVIDGPIILHNRRNILGPFQWTFLNNTSYNDNETSSIAVFSPKREGDLLNF